MSKSDRVTFSESGLKFWETMASEDEAGPPPEVGGPEAGSDHSEQSAIRKSVKETKVIYHIDEEETPYLVKIVQDESETSVRLKDFKSVLPTHLQRSVL